MAKWKCRRGRWCTCLTSRTQHWSDGIEKDATPSSSALTNMAKLGMHKWRLSVWHYKALAGGRHFFTTKTNFKREHADFEESYSGASRSGYILN